MSRVNTTNQTIATGSTSRAHTHTHTHTGDNLLRDVVSVLIHHARNDAIANLVENHTPLHDAHTCVHTHASQRRVNTVPDLSEGTPRQPARLGNQTNALLTQTPTHTAKTHTLSQRPTFASAVTHLTPNCVQNSCALLRRAMLQVLLHDVVTYAQYGQTITVRNKKQTTLAHRRCPSAWATDAVRVQQIQLAVPVHTPHNDQRPYNNARP